MHTIRNASPPNLRRKVLPAQPSQVSAVVNVVYTGSGGLGNVAMSMLSAEGTQPVRWGLAFIGDMPLAEEYRRFCTAMRVEYAVFRQRHRRPYGAWLALVRWLDRLQPRAIVCHSITAVLPCWWHARRYGVPLVAVEHTSNQVKSRTERAGSRLAMAVADRVVLLTNEYRHELKAAHGLLFRDRKVRIIPNGIDVERFRPASRPPLALLPLVRLGMAARFSFSKRQDLLVEMLEQLQMIARDVRFELHLAGDGAELERVRARAKRSTVAAQVHFAGLLDEAEVAEWLRSLDLYVHASEGETLSTSLLQAMATGLPIVASAIPGITNLLSASGTLGCTCENTPDAFARTVIALVASPREALQLGQLSRSRAIERYSHHAMLAAYLDVIDECIR